MMNRTVLALLLGLSCQSFDCQAAEKTLLLKVGGKSVSFTWFEDQGITISSDCVENNQIKNCQAKAALKKINLSNLNEDPSGRNPGALLCSQQTDGQVVWSKDSQGNERTFCKFKDGSMIGSGSLTYYGRLNSK